MIDLFLGEWQAIAKEPVLVTLLVHVLANILHEQGTDWRITIPSPPRTAMAQQGYCSRFLRSLGTA